MNLFLKLHIVKIFIYIYLRQNTKLHLYFNVMLVMHF